MKSMKRRTYASYVTTGMVGIVLVTLAACNSGESTPTTGIPTSGGSAGASSALVFVNNTGDKTLTSVALKGDSGNAVVNTLSGVFAGSAIGDMQFSEGNWLFVNLGGANSVALIDPLSAATPIFEKSTQVGNRPVHIYRDPTDGEVIWTMMDGPVATGLDDVEAVIPANAVPPTKSNPELRVNCATTNGGAVTIFHNSHLGPGGEVPKIIGKVCLFAKGHKVTAFSSGTGIPKRAFISSEESGEIAVIDNDETSPTYLKMTNRIDLCDSNKEACNNESTTPLTTAFTPNTSAPHGIRWSKLTKKIYSIQEGYKQIAEIDPAALTITKKFDLATTPYTSYGISPDGKYLLLRGETTAPQQATKLGVIDLSAATPGIADVNTPDLDGTSAGSFKFSPDSKRFYILAGNGATATKKDRLFAFDWSALAPPVLPLLREIPLVSTGGHGFDVLAQGAGEAKYLAVSNAAPANSVTIINASDNQEKQTVPVGPNPGGVMIYESGAAAAGNQASS